MPSADRAALTRRFAAVRDASVRLVASLSAEDQCVQSMPDASPTKWHLAHTSWFFEAVVLQPHARAWRCFDARFARLFNSYYESLGPRHPRPQRGMLTRPALAEIHAYRKAVDAAVADFIHESPAQDFARAAPLVELGLHHEQQHQELMLTDILHLLSLNPLRPAALDVPALRRPAAEAGWIEHPGGEVGIGHAGAAFAFDNETPRHAVRLQPFALANRLVTNGEYQRFIDDGGYTQPGLWLSDGLAAVQTSGWRAPLYWLDDGTEFTLNGVVPRDADAPVRHLSFYEAAAYAEWAGARLPTEFEWEAAVSGPTPPAQAFGDVWQWTRSSYDPYPRFRPAAGAIGEYNGKFMVGQIVLRGSSLATPEGHARATYRNFFPPAARWQFSGLRLAQDL
ncbi:MAG TPA: ergothioneine biosynthesis protein EgtB [Burkholderiaceae bacterium]|nr:ergothioneine biosynthesis protein EgtB [Burkholderiaceae bacterium]